MLTLTHTWKEHRGLSAAQQTESGNHNVDTNHGQTKQIKDKGSDGGREYNNTGAMISNTIQDEQHWRLRAESFR